MNRRIGLRSASALAIASLFTLLCLPINVLAADCAAMAADYIEWTNPSHHRAKEPEHAVGVKMTTAKIQNRNPDTYPWGYGAVSEGRMDWGDGGVAGRLTVVFSDRRSADRRRFDPRQADFQDVTFFSDGRVRIMLRAWSTTLFLEDVRCYDDGFITGIKREATGVSMVTLALRKEKLHEATDGFRDWP